MKPTAQPIRFLFRVITNASLIDLYLAFTVSSCLMIYKLEKLLDQGFKVLNAFAISPFGNSELTPLCIWDSKLH